MYLPRLLRLANVQGLPRGPQSVILWNWLAVGVLFAFVFVVEKRDLRSLQFKRPNTKDIELSVTFWGIATAASWISTVVLPPQQNTGISTLQAIPIPILIALVLTTATTEEILYRAYPIERLQDLTIGWFAIVSSAFIFILPHIAFFGWQWLITQGVGVVLQYVLYVWRRNIWACMLMHFLGNALILLPATGIVG
ncbi:CPBP family intramembrane glutamic endopeptidase [Leptolyngbya sp. AN03gr2]|uniref:CPBP family intramembrane glutamic endopeptidase n=1 Tax=unclassified Leptolyngbya TaxID=2650499 RepID=UPI003D32233A